MNLSDFYQCDPFALYKSNDTNKLGIIIPYNSIREQFLPIFVNYMVKWLQGFGRNFQIYIVEQVDQLPFNRGSLINIGYQFAKLDGCNYFVSQDVDLV